MHTKLKFKTLNLLQIREDMLLLLSLFNPKLIFIKKEQQKSRENTSLTRGVWLSQTTDDFFYTQLQQNQQHRYLGWL